MVPRRCIIGTAPAVLLRREGVALALAWDWSGPARPGRATHGGPAVNVAGARPDLAAHEKAVRSSLELVVAQLSAVLGERLVAYIGGVTEARAVREWGSGERAIRDPQVPPRLRLGLQLAAMLSDWGDPPDVVQAWFQGVNPQLDDRVPAQLLREGELSEVGPALLEAARAFLIGG